MPIVVCPLLALCFFADSFVVAWSGPQYLDAVPITILFVLLNIFSFLSYPTNSMVTVFEKVKTLKIMAITLPIIYWGGIIMMPQDWSILSFGVMKVFVFWLLIPIYSVISFRILNINWKSFIAGVVKYNILTIVIVSVSAIVLRKCVAISDKGIFQLIEVCCIVMLIALIGYSTSYLLNPYVRNYMVNLRDKLFKAR